MTSPVIPSQAIYLDVEDTLIPSTADSRISPERMVARVRERAQKGAGLYLWSRQGAEHARQVAARCGLEDCFRGFLPKPEVIIDAKALEDWSISEFHPVACTAVRVEDLLRIQRG